MSIDARSVLLGEMLDHAGCRLRERNEARLREYQRLVAEQQRALYETFHAPAAEDLYPDTGAEGDAGC